MIQSKYTRYDPKKISNKPKTDAKTAAPAASVDVPKTAHAWKTAEAAPIPATAPIRAPAQAATSRAPVPPAPVAAATTPAEKASHAMINEGGNSVVIEATHDETHAIREPSALTGDLPAHPDRGNGAAGPAIPVLQTKPTKSTDGANS
jgi:hypothetical protein